MGGGDPHPDFNPDSAALPSNMLDSGMDPGREGQTKILTHFLQHGQVPHPIGSILKFVHLSPDSCFVKTRCN